MRNFIGIGLLGLSLSGCVFVNGSFHQKQVNQFILDKSANPNLTWDVVGQIDEEKKAIDLWFQPSDPVDSLVPRIEWEGMSISLDGQPVQSLVTTVRLKSNSVLSVQGRDETVESYKITLHRLPKVLWYFNFEYGIQDNSGNNFYGAPGEVTPEYPGDYVAIHFPWAITPTEQIRVRLPDLGTTTLVPTFYHSAKSLRCNGVPLISGVTPIDITKNQVLELVGADDSVSSIDLIYTFDPPRLTNLQLLRADNPTLRADYTAEIDEYTHTVNINVPNYVNATAMVPRFTAMGTLKLAETPLESGLSPLNLSAPLTLVVRGDSGRTQAYSVQPRSTVPSPFKSLDNYEIYMPKSNSLYNPWNEYPHSGIRSQLGPDSFVFRSYTSFNLLDKTAVYLEIVTSGVQTALVSGQPLGQGPLTPTRFFPENWIDLSNPIEILITAEDLSTKTVTLSLKAYNE